MARDARNLLRAEAVLSVLRSLWQTRPETASRLRGRIEAVLDAAKAQGLRQGENPARWRGHLDKLLPKRGKLTRGHFAAMPYAEVQAFMGALREREAIAGLALEFAILTAARSGEVLGARWNEIDLEAKVWTVPATRMKAGREHRVPLSTRALAILEKLAEAKISDFVFSGQRPGASRPTASGQPISAARLIPGAIKISNASAVKMSVSPDLIMRLQKRFPVIEPRDFARVY